MSTPSHLSPSYTRISTHTSPSYFFFFNDTATTEIYTLSLHDALPISDWPSAAMSESARMMGGSAISASTTRWLAVSATPPTYAATTPQSQPSVTPNTTEATPTQSESRAPQITRESTSRPRWAGPSGNAAPR